MPTYDYECDSCGHKFEAFHSIKAAALKKCPRCDKLSLRRLIGTGGAIIFKGSGFYITDYRSDSYKKDAKAEADSQKPKTSDSKTDKTDKTKSTSKKKDSSPAPKKE